MALLPHVAGANGRPPNTSFLVFPPGQSAHWILGATFGLLLTRDDGASFEWVCETAVTRQGFLGADPAVIWPTPSALVVGSFSALSVSRDGGCTWQDSPQFAGAIIHDLRASPAEPNGWVVSVTDPNTSTGTLWQTHDAGVSYQRLGLQQAGIAWGGVRLAPHDARVLMAAGWRPADGDGPFIARSNDGGRSWHTARLPGGPQKVLHATLELNPGHPQQILVAATDSASHAEILLRSEDGGKSARVVQSLPDGFRGIFTSDDGSTVWIATLSRVLRSADAGKTFAPLASPQVNACLGRRGAELFACGNGKADGFALARSHDGGFTWNPAFMLPALKGPLSCPQGSTVQVTCPALWRQIAGPIGVPLPPPPPATRPPQTGDSAAPPPKGGCQCDSSGSVLWGACLLLGLRACGRRLLII